MRKLITILLSAMLTVAGFSAVIAQDHSEKEHGSKKKMDKMDKTDKMDKMEKSKKSKKSKKMEKTEEK